MIAVATRRGGDPLEAIFNGFIQAFDEIANALAEARYGLPTTVAEVYAIIESEGLGGLIDRLESVWFELGYLNQDVRQVIYDFDEVVAELSPETIELAETDIEIVELYADNLLGELAETDGLIDLILVVIGL